MESAVEALRCCLHCCNSPNIVCNTVLNLRDFREAPISDNLYCPPKTIAVSQFKRSLQPLNRDLAKLASIST
ncbi:hypothetical protein COCSUDRAFT_32080 [Coccomyxa subellipsoidea C-169]|uniref:Uncharacterized protein n=1 Tax=Coccomyxa subellipsoidea (strain C-169) TaxID=574566 RepID=I0ZAN6_COCSC|nr:hypothetical protein COCSUDRAFT_32080 [Coccomyxa subellipsoidea C-169]EIE27705.1 hypothetical protein COCSUDRAFT_32080 [Coccomyxa subellipsoidea C-169]|eukprot:XP_005652249.1 hypothetical protein COCSUDRAFT_32080 [Coccomyxa subellipsoidea C-169]